jgi:predicted phage terminase large subunit-like protein
MRKSQPLRNLSPAQLAAVRHKAELELARQSLAAFAERVFGFAPARHHREWVAALEDRAIRRLLIVAPPGHAKTSWISIFYPAWRVGREPTVHLGLLSNTATQAHRPSVAVRDTVRASDAYRELFIGVTPDYVKGWAEHEWFVQRARPGDKDATMVATGVFGPILGGRFDELILDDVVDAENSATARGREKLRDWILTTALSRLVPDGRVICVMTRWHEGDLAATFIEQGFTLVRMPALGYWKEGEALWPAVWPPSKLEEKRRELGSLSFEGMYQGNPTIPTGDVLKRAWWRVEEPWPKEFDDTIQVYDTAFKESAAADFSVCVTLGRVGGRAYVRDVLRERLAWPDLMRAVRAQYERHRPRLCLIEDRASGQSLIQALRQEAIPVLPVRADKSKLARTTAISGFVEAGRVCLPRHAAWLDDFLEETAAFPRGTHDDQVDALVHGLTYYFLRDEGETVVTYEEPVSITPELDEIDARFGFFE